MPVLYSNIQGSGSPLLILHGFLGMSDNWKTLGNQYAESDFEVHLIDQRNHGRSFWSDAFNYEVMATDLVQYMDAKGLERASLIGHSMGGKTVMHFACTYPERTDKLLVADIAPKYYPPHHQPIIDALNSLKVETLESRREADEKLARHIGNKGIRQFLLKNLHRTENGLAFRFNLRVLSQRMPEIGEPLGSSEHFDGPVLFLRGSGSEYVSSEDTAEIKRHFPAARIETVENAGHWLHAENPEQFFEKSLAFLNS